MIIYQCAQLLKSSFSLLRHSPQVHCCPERFCLAAFVLCTADSWCSCAVNVMTFRKFSFLKKLKYGSSLRYLSITVCYSLICQTRKSGICFTPPASQEGTSVKGYSIAQWVSLQGQESWLLSNKW